MKRFVTQGFFERFLKVYILMLCFIYTSCAFAEEATGLPWETPLQKILASVTGPVAKVLGVLAIVISGFAIAFGEAGSGMRRFFQVILGLSIAFTASALLVTLFGITG